MEKWYSNIGKKIKGLAFCTFIIEAIAVAVSAFALMSEDNDFIVISLLMLLIGPIIAWISSWILYAFGEMVEKTSENEMNTRELLNLKRMEMASASKKEAATADHSSESSAKYSSETLSGQNVAPHYCIRCGAPYTYENYCPKCGNSVK